MSPAPTGPAAPQHRSRPTHTHTSSRGRGLSLAVLGCLALVAVTGCRAEVVTTIAPRGALDATVTVSAVFTAEAAEVISDDAESRAGLRELFESRSGQRPEITVTDELVEASTTVSLEELPDLAEVTGVEGVTITQGGDRVEVAFGPATQLVSTVTAQNAGEADAEALTATMLSNTHLVVRVEMGAVEQTAVVRTGPGGDRTAVQGPVPGQDPMNLAQVGALSVEDASATLDRTADQDTAGVLVVDGTAESTPWLLFLGGGLLAAAAVTFVVRRRR